MPFKQTGLGRCPRCGRVFSIPSGRGKAFCDRIACKLAALERIAPDQAGTVVEPAPALKLTPRYHLGRFEQLDADRQVFLAPDGDNRYLVTFTDHGINTDLILSGEAIEALCRLYQSA